MERARWYSACSTLPHAAHHFLHRYVVCAQQRLRFFDESHGAHPDNQRNLFGCSEPPPESEPNIDIHRDVVTSATSDIESGACAKSHAFPDGKHDNDSGSESDTDKSNTDSHNEPSSNAWCPHEPNGGCEFDNRNEALKCPLGGGTIARHDGRRFSPCVAHRRQLCLPALFYLPSL